MSDFNLPPGVTLRDIDNHFGDDPMENWEQSRRNPIERLDDLYDFVTGSEERLNVFLNWLEERGY